MPARARKTEKVMICPNCGTEFPHDCALEYTSRIGKLGGAAKSARKTAACRLNAKLGGWPRGRKRGPHARVPSEPPPATPES
jgi:hypothetical protein